MNEAPPVDRNEVRRLVNELVDKLSPESSERERRFQRRLLYTAARVVQERGDLLNLKIMARSLGELRNGFNTFSKWADSRKVAVFGSARTRPEDPHYQMAVDLSRLLVERGYMVVTGAGPGIMEAANKGAGKENSFGVNIELPFETDANPFIAGDEKLVNFRFFFTRKVVFVKETDAVVLLPGGFGTQDELFETLTLIQTGKSEPTPVVMVEEHGGSYWRDWDRYVRDALLGRGLISADDLNLYQIVHDIDGAVEYIERFYRNYHSIRYIDGKLIIRVRQPPTELLLQRLNEDFADILVDGRIEVVHPHPVEADEGLEGVHRIQLHFNQRSLGRLRQLIDTLSAAVTPEIARTQPRIRAVHRVTPADE